MWKVTNLGPEDRWRTFDDWAEAKRWRDHLKTLLKPQFQHKIKIVEVV